ncbi:MFS-type efflux pump [Alteripontixanthobacter maritimus]|uniref:MFS-type efflux pump n=1 Tax=Alteripontixanthobacter maritimus TaxID=2161824 RepID=A0A369QFE9_9SPHN|nr:MFS transporter [Alteripontixanthobacter maritimus]RDC61018.1 MFS-type efflux pump [Alteripontixanthobacter maritimus]
MSDNQTAAVTAEATTPPDDQPVPAYSWYALGVLVLVYILNFIDRQILSILANDIKADLGVDDAYLGFLYGTAFAIFYALFGIPLGKLADSWKRVRLMTIGLAVWSGMTALSGFAKNGTMLTFARVGVGVGEATASPSAYSLISDWFPARLRATALAIYSSGLYIGGGISLLIGGLIVENWNAAYPDGGPLGLAGWQAAFISVGLPGLLLALWVMTLREPIRGAIDGMPTREDPAPFRGFVQELMTVIPPFTLIGAAKRGMPALFVNIAVLIAAFVAAYFITGLLDSGEGAIYGPISDQWFFLAIGYYAIFCWATALRTRDAPTFALTWGSPAFLCTILGYGCVAFIAYAASYWTAPYAERVFEVNKAALGWWIGAPSAVAGFLGVITGGRVADILFRRYAAGRLFVVLFGLIAPIPIVLIQFTTDNLVLFYVLAFVAQLFTSSALGAAAASSQALVLPRMRGIATATFFLATTLVGLALGPYLAGYISSKTDGDLGLGVMSTLGIAPIGFVLLAAAIKLVPRAQAGLLAKARAAGEQQ